MRKCGKFLLFFLPFLLCRTAFAFDWKTGKMNFTFTSDVYYQDVVGMEESSLLHEGWNYLEELQGDFTQQLIKGKLNVDAHFHIRTSNDPQHQIAERDFMFVEGYARLYNDAFEIWGGDYAENYTSYTLSTSLLGLKSSCQIKDWLKVYVLWGRNRDEELDGYVRYTAGGRVELIHKGITLGTTVVYSDVDRDSLKEDSPIGDELNYVFGADLHLSLWDRLKIDGEFARSIYNEDQRDESVDDIYDSAYLLSAELILRSNLTLKGEFERVEPWFRSVHGSPSSDMQRYKGEIQYLPLDELGLFLLYEFSYDKVSHHSEMENRTYMEMTSFNADLKPFIKRQDIWNTLGFTFQADYTKTYSDDSPRTLDTEDLRLSTTASQSFSFWNYSVGYSYSRTWDHVDETTEYFTHSPSFSLGFNYNWLALSWNWNFGFSFTRKETVLMHIVDRSYRGEGGLGLSYDKTRSNLNMNVTAEYCDNSSLTGAPDNFRWTYSAMFDQVIKETESLSITLSLSASYSDYDEYDSDGDYEETIYHIKLNMRF